MHKGELSGSQILSDYLRIITSYLDDLAERVGPLLEPNQFRRIDTKGQIPGDLSIFNLEFLVGKYGKRIQMVLKQIVNGETYLLAERPVVSKQ